MCRLWGCAVADPASGDLPRFLYANALASATASASSTDAAADVAYATDGRLDRAWQPASGTTHTLRWDFAAPISLSAWGLHGHNLGLLPDVSVLAEYDGAAGWTPFTAAFAPIGTRSVYRCGQAVSAVAFRLTITHTGSTLPVLAAAMAGADLVCERGLQPGWEDPLLARQPRTRPAQARDGTPLPGSIEDARHQGAVQLQQVSADWAINSWLPFRRACDGAQAPALFTWAPATYPDHACWCSGMQFDAVRLAGRGRCDVGVQARMDSETGWGPV
jgi:hypothetical protein